MTASASEQQSSAVNIIFSDTDYDKALEALLDTYQFETERDAAQTLAVAQMSPRSEWLGHANDAGGVHVAVRFDRSTLKFEIAKLTDNPAF